MKHGLSGFLILTLTLGLAACGRDAGDPADDPGTPAFEIDADSPMEQRLEPAPRGETVEELPSPFDTPSVEPPPEPAPAPEAAAPAEPATPAISEAGATDATHAALIGTEWTAKGVEATFVAADRVHLKGGPVQMFPDGIEAQYTYSEDGTLELTLMGNTLSGSWDGEQLVIDGERATRR